MPVEIKTVHTNGNSKNGIDFCSEEGKIEGAIANFNGENGIKVSHKIPNANKKLGIISSLGEKIVYPIIAGIIVLLLAAYFGLN